MSTSYPIQVAAVALPTALSLKEVLSGGNLVLATVAALLAVLAGLCALRKQRIEADTAEINKQIAERRLRRELRR